MSEVIEEDAPLTPCAFQIDAHKFDKPDFLFRFTRGIEMVQTLGFLDSGTL